MAITAQHILYDIRNIATSGSNPNNFRIEDAQTLYWIDEIRALLISQAIQKRQDISDIWLQQIPCLELIEVDKSECCELTTTSNILRTSLQIPTTIEYNGDNLIIRVEDPDGNIISKCTPFESKYSGNSKYTSTKVRWFLKNNYIYVLNTTDTIMDFININCLFEKPSEVGKYVSCGGTYCYTTLTPYPCSIKMASDITNIILKTKIYPFLQLPQDNSNDNSNDFKQQVDSKNI